MTSKVRQAVEILRQVLWKNGQVVRKTDRWWQIAFKVRQAVEILRQVV